MQAHYFPEYKQVLIANGAVLPVQGAAQTTQLRSIKNTKHRSTIYPKYLRVKIATGSIASREGTFAIRMLK